MSEIFKEVDITWDDFLDFAEETMDSGEELYGCKILSIRFSNHNSDIVFVYGGEGIQSYEQVAARFTSKKAFVHFSLVKFVEKYKSKKQKLKKVIKNMNPVNFTYWLQGFFELTDSKSLTPEQIEMIKEHLELALENEKSNSNPYIDIAPMSTPSLGDLPGMGNLWNKEPYYYHTC